jgi:hypothetical protein
MLRLSLGPNRWPSGGALFLKVKWLGLEVDHLTPSSVEVENEWSYACAPLVCLHSMHRDITFFCVPAC